MTYIQFWAPDDGRRNRLKHVQHFTEINKLCSIESCWLHLKIRLRCTDPWTSNPLSMFLIGHISCKPTYWNNRRFQRTNSASNQEYPINPQKQAHVPADHYCLPTFKRGVKTTKNLNTSESTTVWHCDHRRVLSHAKTPPPLPQNVMCVYAKRPSLLPFRFTETTRPALNAKLEIS